VNKNFSDAGIMVHAYLMYGFPTQTAQETIDSLEMVRQMFQAEVLQSAFWHQFTMTAHSPIGLDPDAFKVKKETALIGSFANNDIVHIDPTGADHESFGFGLKKSLLNYMHGACLDYPLQKWFDFKVPKTSIQADYIQSALRATEYVSAKPTTRVVWLGKQPLFEISVKSKKGNQWEVASVTFRNRKETLNIKVDVAQGEWLTKILAEISSNPDKTYTLKEVKENYEAAGLEDFELFWDNKPVNNLYRFGLLHL